MWDRQPSFDILALFNTGYLCNFKSESFFVIAVKDVTMHRIMSRTSSYNLYSGVVALHCNLKQMCLATGCTISIRFTIIVQTTCSILILNLIYCRDQSFSVSVQLRKCYISNNVTTLPAPNHQSFPSSLLLFPQIYRFLFTHFLRNR